MQGGLRRGGQDGGGHDPSHVCVHCFASREVAAEAFDFGVFGVQVREAGDVSEVEALELGPGALDELVDERVCDRVERFVRQTDPLAA